MLSGSRLLHCTAAEWHWPEGFTASQADFALYAAFKDAGIDFAALQAAYGAPRRYDALAAGASCRAVA